MLLNVSYIFDGIMDYLVTNIYILTNNNKYLIYKCVNFSLVTSLISMFHNSYSGQYS